jgi:hypothetical protein
MRNAVGFALCVVVGGACGRSAPPGGPPAIPGDTPAADAAAPGAGPGGDGAADGPAALPGIDAPPGDGGAGEGGRGDAAVLIASDGGPPPASSASETIAVPGSGTPVTFMTSLARGGIYLLKASGTVEVGGQQQDAEYLHAPGAPQGSDLVNGVDVGIDVGLLQPNRPRRFTQVPPGPGRIKWSGGASGDRACYLTVTGAGQPLTIKLVTSGPATGAIQVSLYELSPPSPAVYRPMPAAPAPPPKIGRQPLESVQVPVFPPETIVTGKVTTEAGAIYLLQASGAATVGGGGLQLGDAEYDDFAATPGGNGFNDGESCADFGIGVDELTVSHCGGDRVVPRKNWWGMTGVDRMTTPYRNDHVYYMVYAGTGKPISYTYFDSGYGDNSHTQALTVQLFPMP